MKKCLLVVSLFALCSFQSAVLTFTDMHVIKAAEGQLGVYTSRIPAGDASKYGFRQEDDMENLVVGKPYRTIEFNPDFYLHETENNRNYLDIRNEWKVPVSSQGRNRVMLTLQGISGNYKVTGMGDTLLARELQPISRGLNDSDEFYLLHVPTLKADFFVHEADNSFADATFIPLNSALVALKNVRKKNEDSYTLDQVQKMVKDALTLQNKEREKAAAKSNTTPTKKTPTPAAKKPVKKPATK